MSQIQRWQWGWWVNGDYSRWRLERDHLKKLKLLDHQDLESGSDTQTLWLGCSAVSFTWTFPPLDQALFDLWDLRAGVAKGWWVLDDLSRAGLLAAPEPTGSTGPRAGAPLAPLAHLAVHWKGGDVWLPYGSKLFSLLLSNTFASCSCSTLRSRNVAWAPSNRGGNFFHTGLTLCCAVHEFVIGLIVLWTDMVAPSTELVETWPAPRARLTVHTWLTLRRALCTEKSTVTFEYLTRYQVSCGSFIPIIW